MSMVPVYNWEKKKVGEVELPATVFEQPIRNDIMHEVVVWQLACRRQGTASTKTRAFVRGGGKKPFKQKGTGNARQGTSRSPLMPGGAILFGPQPRDYSYTLPKKVKRAGLRSALSYLVKEGRFFVVEDVKSSGKSKDMAKNLKGFGMKSCVVVDSQEDALAKRASGNLADFRYLAVDGLNVYDLLTYDGAIVTKAGLTEIVRRAVAEGN